MNNEESRENSENKVSESTSDDKNIKEPVVPNSTDPKDSPGTSRSPGKDRGGDRSVEAQN
jgi:hypothetical protein